MHFKPEQYLRPDIGKHGRRAALHSIAEAFSMIGGLADYLRSFHQRGDGPDEMFVWTASTLHDMERKLEKAADSIITPPAVAAEYERVASVMQVERERRELATEQARDRAATPLGQLVEELETKEANAKRGTWLRWLADQVKKLPLDDQWWMHRGLGAHLAKRAGE